MKKEVTWIDIKNEPLMQALGIHPRDVEPRDESVWSKTNAEKKQLRKLRKSIKTKMVGSVPKDKSIPIYGTLIIHLKKVEPFYTVKRVNGQKEVYFKSTLSIKCGQADLPRILSNYSKAILYYNWMGKTYQEGQLPFWYANR